MNFENVGSILVALVMYRMLRPGIDMLAAVLWAERPDAVDHINPPK